MRRLFLAGVLVTILTSPIGHSVISASAAQSPLISFPQQPGFSATARMRLHKFPCEVRAGTISRVGDKVRVDVTEFLADDSSVNCDADELWFSLVYDCVTKRREPNVLMIDHKAKAFELSRLSQSDSFLRLSMLGAAQPYSVLMGWPIFAGLDGPGTVACERQVTIDGHPCDQLLDGDPDTSWTRYYAARDLGGLVIRVEWDSQYKGPCGECPPRFFPPAGVVSLSDVVLRPPEIKLAPPPGYRKRRVR